MPAKGDSDVMFCLQSYQGLESKDHLCINPILRIGLIHKWSIDSHKLRWSVQVNVLLTNCKQNMTSLSLLVGTTVHNNLNIFFSETSGLIQLKFHIEYPLDEIIIIWLLALDDVFVFLVLSHTVSRVRRGTWLYRFLIFAIFLTFKFKVTLLKWASGPYMRFLNLF